MEKSSLVVYKAKLPIDYTTKVKFSQLTEKVIVRKSWFSRPLFKRHIIAEYQLSHKQFILCVSFHSVLKLRSKYLKQMFLDTKNNNTKTNEEY